MADNYLENKFEKMKEREAAKVRARQAAYRKRMEAYRRQLDLERQLGLEAMQKDPNPVSGNHSDKE